LKHQLPKTEKKKDGSKKKLLEEKKGKEGGAWRILISKGLKRKRDNLKVGLGK